MIRGLGLTMVRYLVTIHFPILRQIFMLFFKQISSDTVPLNNPPPRLFSLSSCTDIYWQFYGLFPSCNSKLKFPGIVATKQPSHLSGQLFAVIALVCLMVTTVRAVIRSDRACFEVTFVRAITDSDRTCLIVTSVRAITDSDGACLKVTSVRSVTHSEHACLTVKTVRAVTHSDRACLKVTSVRSVTHSDRACLLVTTDRAVIRSLQ